VNPGKDQKELQSAMCVSFSARNPHRVLVYPKTAAKSSGLLSALYPTSSEKQQSPSASTLPNIPVSVPAASNDAVCQLEAADEWNFGRVVMSEGGAASLLLLVARDAIYQMPNVFHNF
jgi:hypothetical protein